MNTIRDEVASNIVAGESPADGSGRAVMKWCHGIHEVRHMTRPCGKCLIQHGEVSSGVPDRNNPTAAAKLAHEIHAARDLRRQRDHMFGTLVDDCWQVV